MSLSSSSSSSSLFVTTVAIASVLITHALAGSDVYLTPTKTTGPQIGIVLCQGAQIDASTYIPLAKAIQDAAPFQIWVGIPEFPLSTPEPSASAGIERAISTLHSKGLPTNALIVTAGHSLGGAQVQGWTNSNPKGVVGQILMGAALLRKYRNQKYPVPTMALGGTLDGLFRITRHAENYYHYTKTLQDANFPTVLFEGVSHMQFSSGTPPALVAHSDLQPEVSYAEAHTEIAETIALFLEAQINKNSTAAAALAMKSADTGAIVEPITLSQKQEAFQYLTPTCNSDFPLPANCPAYPRYPSGQKSGSNPGVCACGTPWSATAQGLLGPNTSTYSVDATDAVHGVSDINPIHLPHIWNNCSAPPCRLNITTVTYPSYPTLTFLDTGFSYISADELRVKLVSRQAMLMAAGETNVNFTATDVVPSLCAAVNELAWKWALQVSGQVALNRFNKIGIPMAFGQDIFLGNAGPLWIENPIEYKYNSDKSVMNVYSPCSHTPVDYPIKAAAGFHYCKLLSPARALEWIYLDSLRVKGGLKPNSTSA